MSQSKKMRKENYVHAPAVWEGKMNLVFDIVIRSLQCSKLLRRSRLVCKRWNVAASATLRKKFVTSFQEDYSVAGRRETFEFDRFQDFMKRFPLKGNLPCSFLRISLKFRSIEEKEFWNLTRQLVERKDFLITELEFEFWHFGKKSIKFIDKILTSVQGTLTSLTLKISSYTRDDIPDPIQIHLINLKKLRIDCGHPTKKCPMIQSYLKALVKDILHLTKLTVLTLEVADFEFMSELLSIKNVDTALSLQLGTVKLCEKDYVQIHRYFQKNPIRNLKGLAISVVDISLDHSQILSVFSNSLEILSLEIQAEFQHSLDLFPVCPNVRELKLRGPSVSLSGQFLPEKFPSLKKLLLRVEKLPIFDTIKPHFGVNYLDISVESMSGEHNSEECLYCKTRKDINENFSKLTSYFPKNERACFATRALWALIKSFPNVKALALNCWFNLTDIPAFEMLSSEREFEGTFLFECIFKDIYPLQNFLELETLDVSQEQMHPEIIRYSLANIPKLKYLRMNQINFRKEIEFKYNDEAVQATRQCLNHLKEVQINFCKSMDVYKVRPLRNSLSEELRPVLVTSFCNCRTCNLYLCKCQVCNPFGVVEFNRKFD